jgi:hypothetical protein
VARYGPAVRMLLALAAGAVLGVGAWLLIDSPFGNDPVTRADIERVVAKRPAGKVQVTLCNEEFVAGQATGKDAPHRWTCDTYIGPTKADTQNGPSYRVLVRDGEITSVERVPTH